MINPELQIEYLREKLKTYVELLKIWVALIIATTGGLVGLLFKLEHKVTLSLIFLGGWLDFIFLIAFISTLAEINQILKEIKKWTGKF